MIDWKAARECASTHILQESLNYRNLKAAHLELLRLAEDVTKFPMEDIENLRRAMERGLSAAQKRNDCEGIDTFQHCLDIYYRTVFNSVDALRKAIEESK